MNCFYFSELKKKFFRNTIIVSFHLNPDQARQNNNLGPKVISGQYQQAKLFSSVLSSVRVSLTNPVDQDKKQHTHNMTSHMGLHCLL